MSITEGSVPTGKPEYSWHDLLNRVAALRQHRDQLQEQLEAAGFSEREMQEELDEALAGNRPKADKPN